MSWRIVRAQTICEQPCRVFPVEWNITGFGKVVTGTGGDYGERCIIA